jgi:hypothetical protein
LLKKKVFSILKDSSVMEIRLNNFWQGQDIY